MTEDRDGSEDDFRSVLYTVDREGHRKRVHADIAGGRWRRRRIVASVLLIAFFLALPFVRIGGEPLLRIDIPNRHYVLVGQTFWPQDFGYLLLFALLGVVGTLTMVALLGRVFCGWLCPHNIFLEMVFRPIEQFLEGRAHRRRRQDAGPLTADLALRKSVKWLCFVLVAGALANTGTAIFVGTEAFIGGVLIDPIAHPSAAIFFAAFFALTLFDFGWFREQTCTLVCPYGRLQAAMLDSHTLIVAYDEQRGEPRGKPGKVSGDCVDCTRCIQVCPTGIDIRNGTQLECIHCTACIDACDAVMRRLKRPEGLIRYSSEHELAGKQRRLLRPRNVLYAVVLTALLGLTIWLLSTRSTIEVSRLRDNAGAQLIEDDGQQVVLRPVKLALINHSGAPVHFSFALDALPGRLVTQNPAIELAPGERVTPMLFLRVPASLIPEAGSSGAIVVRAGETSHRVPLELRRP